MPISEVTLERLAASPLPRMQRAENGRFAFEEEGLFVAEDIRSAINLIREAYLECMEDDDVKDVLPPDLAVNPLLSEMIFEQIPEYRPRNGNQLRSRRNRNNNKRKKSTCKNREPKLSPIERLPNILPFFPYYLDEDRVMEKLSRVADALAEKIREIADIKPDTGTIERAKTAIRKGLAKALRTNLENLNQHPLFRTDIYDPQAEETRKHFSMHDLKVQVREIGPKVDSGEIAKKDAMLHLMASLGMIDEPDGLGEDKKEEIRQDIERNLNDAWEVYENIGQKLNEAKELFEIEGEPVNTHSHPDNRKKSAFELLDYLINKPNGNIPQLNEAQNVLYFANLLLAIEVNPSHKKAAEMENEAKEKFEELFVPESNENVEYFEDDRGIIYDKQPRDKTCIKHEGVVKRLKIVPGHESMGEQRVLLLGPRVKTKVSKAIRLIRHPDFALETIPDAIGGRMVIWDKKRTGMTEEDIQYLQDTSKLIGVVFGLNHRDVEKENLQPGESCTKNKLSCNQDNKISLHYHAQKAYGKTEEGVTLEWQIILRDTFDYTVSEKSPGHPKSYDRTRNAALAMLMYRGQANLYGREVAIILLAKLEEAQFKFDGQFQKAAALAEKRRARKSRKATPSRLKPQRSGNGRHYRKD